MMWLLLATLILPFLALEATTSELSSRWSSKPKFVTVGANRRFSFGGFEFPVIGTTVYWLPALNTEEDIEFTLGNISQAGFNVVRTWAFNDVTSIPEDGTWFQLIRNGTLTINNGANGLQKLDTVVRLAEKYKLFLILSLTNNWNPHPSDSAATSGPGTLATRWATNTASVQRNVLSNQYGGMDVYVRELAPVQDHGQFFVNETIINAFKDYTTQVVSRYVDKPNIFSWEIANDPRCNSTLPNSPSCATTTVTQWHATMADHIKSVDPNHLVSSGASGFFCLDCPKLFQKPTPSGPKPSASPSASPMARRGISRPLTKKSVYKWTKGLLKRLKEVDIVDRTTFEGGIRIRGRWSTTTQAKRQSGTGPGPAFDGSSGVDSGDILGIKNINVGSGQLAPNQYLYVLGQHLPGGPGGTGGGLMTRLQGQSTPPGLPAPLTANQSLTIGLSWIQLQAEAAIRSNKPIIFTSFGLVTQNNANAFVPFNSSEPAFGNGADDVRYGVSDEERDQIYQQWIQASISSGLSGVVQYQWGQSGLSAHPGSPIPSPSTQTGSTGNSPNDGYSIQGEGAAQFIKIIQEESQAVGAVPT